MLGLGSAPFVSVQLSGFSGRNQDRSDRDRSWLWQRETGLEPATSTLGRCRSVLEFRRAPITAAGCLSTPIFEGRQAAIGGHQPPMAAWMQVILRRLRRTPGSSPVYRREFGGVLTTSVSTKPGHAYQTRTRGRRSGAIRRAASDGGVSACASTSSTHLERRSHRLQAEVGQGS